MLIVFRKHCLIDLSHIKSLAIKSQPKGNRENFNSMYFFFFFLFFFNFIFKLYITVLVLPNASILPNNSMYFYGENAMFRDSGLFKESIGGDTTNR